MINYKSKIIAIVKWLAVDLYEIVVDIYIKDNILFNTVEWRKNDDKVYLHKIVGEVDYQFDYDDMSEEDQLEILNFLIANYIG